MTCTLAFTRLLSPPQNVRHCYRVLYSYDQQYQLFKMFNLEDFIVEESWRLSDKIQVSHVEPGEN